MRMLFICVDIDEFEPDYKGEFFLSVGLLSAILKQNGHHVDLIHIIEKNSKHTLIASIKQLHPDLIGFTAMSQKFPYIKEYAGWIKEECDIPIIIGGIHPTLNPDETIALKEIDMICIGEGEEALLELCNKIENGEPTKDIQSIWSKNNGKIKKNSVRPLVENIDEFPLPDRKIFNIKKLHYANKRYPFATITASRGCLFSCTYCSNHKIKALYPNRHKIVRFHSVERVIEEARQILKEVPFLKFFYFHDDVLPSDIHWFRDFAKKWKKEIGILYRCKSRVELMDEERAILLKESGCFKIQFGIESGNPEILKLLKRPVRPEKVLKAFELCRKYGIQTHAYNMVGIPHENTSKILDTIKRNAIVKPDISMCTIYYPVPNTELYNICKKEGLLTDKKYISYQSESTIVLKDISPIKVKFFHRYFRSLVELYHILYKSPKPLCHILVSILDFVLIKMSLPYRALIYIHDKYFKNKLLDKAYFKVEDKLFGKYKDDRKMLLSYMKRKIFSI